MGETIYYVLESKRTAPGMFWNRDAARWVPRERATVYREDERARSPLAGQWVRVESPVSQPTPKAEVGESPAIPEATARPWRIYDYESHIGKYPRNIIASPTGESIAAIEGGWPQCSLAENEANAELIVTAVNERDADKARLEKLEAALTLMSCTCFNPDGSYPHDGKNADCNLNIARAALIESPKESE